MTEDETIAAQANEAHVSGWLDAIDRSRDFTEDWAAIPDAERVRRNSEAWCGRFLRAGFDPYHQTGKVRHSAGPAGPDTFDVLRHEFTAEGLGLEVIETVQFTIVRFEIRTLVQLREQDKRLAISGAAARVLNFSGAFLFPQTIAEGSLFSTSPQANPITLRAWTDRVDGGIREGRLFFLCYKRTEPTDGKPLFLNGQHWFDGKCWELAAAPRRS